MTRKPRLLLLCALCAATLAGGLSACAPLVLGGAAMGTLVAIDRRTSGMQLEDEGIEFRASNRMREAFGDTAHINITSYNRQVLLTGEVPNAQSRQLAEQVIGKVENVRAIVNELAVMGSASLVQRSSDTLTTGKVKASLVDAKDLYASAFKVVTERGTVYLMGRVTQREASRATEITRTVGGVQKVVRILEIISEDELRRQLPSQAPAAAPAGPASSATPATQ